MQISSLRGPAVLRLVSRSTCKAQSVPEISSGDRGLEIKNADFPQTVEGLVLASSMDRDSEPSFGSGAAQVK